MSLFLRHCQHCEKIVSTESSGENRVCTCCNQSIYV